MRVLLVTLSLCLSVEGSAVQRSLGDYYTSQHALRRLAAAEEQVADAVEEYVSVLERRLEKARQLLSDYATSGIAFNGSGLPEETGEGAGKGALDLRSYSVSAHPLRAYRLLRRFTQDLPNLEKELRSDQERKFLKLTEKVKSQLVFPTVRDVEGATEGILRVHDTYNMPIDQFTAGHFQSLETNASMSAADCVQVGRYALKSTIFTRAVQWLERAYRLVTLHGDHTIAPHLVRERLEEAILQHNAAVRQGSKNPYLFTEPVTLDQALRNVSRKRVLDTRPSSLGDTHSSFTDLTNFAALCAGKQLRTAEALRGLKCWYERGHPLTRLQPLKLESHSVTPRVLQIHELISDSLTEKLVARATESMSRSQVHSRDDKVTSSVRTSTTAWLQDQRFRQLVRAYQRVETLSGLRIVGAEVGELLQISCYGIAGHFNPHLDTVFNSVEGRLLDAEEKRRGDRLATLMLYLSNVPLGGATAFPRLGVAIPPEKGSALLWENMSPEGEPDPLSLHGGCPILYGNKCVANKWIRFNPQIRKCQPRSGQPFQ